MVEQKAPNNRILYDKDNGDYLDFQCTTIPVEILHMTLGYYSSALIKQIRSHTGVVLGYVPKSHYLKYLILICQTLLDDLMSDGRNLHYN